jgi:hypothetical protein
MGEPQNAQGHCRALTKARANRAPPGLQIVATVTFIRDLAGLQSWAG